MRRLIDFLLSGWVEQLVLGWVLHAQLAVGGMLHCSDGGGGSSLFVSRSALGLCGGVSYYVGGI